MTADLGHVETWLFDLDNTLYPLESGLAEQMSARITTYVARLTGLGAPEAHALQKRYLTEHGLTLRGLMLHHGVDPADFHAIFADLGLGALTPVPALRDAIARLPGRRLVFTNADEHHAARVLRAIGLAECFDDVFHIARAGFVPKPHPECFQRLLEAHAVSPAAAAFFEDAPANLEPAAALGMTTVLVGPAARRAPRPPFVDHLAPDLAGFLTAARVKEPA